MLMATTLLTREEREAALNLLPWGPELRVFAGRVNGSLKNQSVDMIDAALGPNHVRAALVAAYEGTDLLLEAAIDLASSVACERYFKREIPIDPLGYKPLTNPEELARIPLRLARYAVEDAATRVVTAGDHLANTHVRLAWEANAATMDEVMACRFDPTEDEPKSWIGAIDLRQGLAKATSPLGVFSAFALNAAFNKYIRTPAVEHVRQYRHAVIHRARPTYRELPAMGRSTLWAQNTFSIKFPPPAPGTAIPSLADYREAVAKSIEATFAYARGLWAHAVRWLQSLDIWITYGDGEVTIQTSHGSNLCPAPRSFIARLTA